MTWRNIANGVLLAFTALPFDVSDAQADGMMLVRDPHVKVFEPRQQAIVAWNGAEEILILRVEVRASEDTEALQVIPFPSEPNVTKGRAEAFVVATEFINDALIAM